LGQLAQLRRSEHLAQLRLAHHDDLQQLALVGLQVGEQAHLLEGVRRQVLRLVDQHDGAPAPRVRVEQVSIEPVDEHLDAVLPVRIGDVQLVANGGDQLQGCDARVQHQGHVGVRRQLLEQAAAHRCLAGADLAGEQHEAAGAHPI
jgi:hypothetical protein